MHAHAMQNLPRIQHGGKTQNLLILLYKGFKKFIVAANSNFTL